MNNEKSLNLRFGMSSAYFQSLTEEIFSDLQSMGVKELELSFSNDAYDTLEWEVIKNRAEKFGIHLWTLHLPFYNLPFSPADKLNIADRDNIFYWYHPQ